MSKRKKIISVLVGCLAALAALFIFVAVRLSPTVEAIAARQATREATRLINESVLALLDEEGLDYDALVTVSRADNGRISSLNLNMEKINRFKSSLTELLADSLEKIDVERLSVPLGNALGSVFTSGRGPNIPVRIVSVGSVVSTLNNDFSAAGINQTRHRVLLSVELCFSLAFPGGSREVTVTDTICIAETVLAGEIPEFYAEF